MARTTRKLTAAPTKQLVRPEIALLLDSLDEAFDKKSWHGPNLRSSIRGVSPVGAAARARSSQYSGAHGPRSLLEVRSAPPHHRRKARLIRAAWKQFLPPPCRERSAMEGRTSRCSNRSTPNCAGRSQSFRPPHRKHSTGSAELPRTTCIMPVRSGCCAASNADTICITTRRS